MVDETDPELNEASRRQDAADAAKFRADAAEIREEAAHDRDEATKFRGMGLKAEADKYTKDAEVLEKNAVDFQHRAELLDDAIHHRKSVAQGLEMSRKAETEATIVHKEATEIDARLQKGGLDDDTYIELTGDAAAAHAREAALHDLAGSRRSGAESELEYAAIEEEVKARAGLPGRNVEVIEGMPPLIDPWAPAPDGDPDAVEP